MLKPPIDLVAAAVAGDNKSTEMLLELAWPEAYRIARFTLGNATAAEDAAQEACARALLSIAKLKDPASFSVWFYRIVVNEAMTLHRKSTRSDDAFAQYGHYSDLSGAEDRWDVRNAVAALPVHLRIVVLLFYYFDLSGAEIAGMLDISAVAVRLRLMIARRWLRGLLDDSAMVADRSLTKGDACAHERELA